MPLAASSACGRPPALGAEGSDGQPHGAHVRSMLSPKPSNAAFVTATSPVAFADTQGILRVVAPRTWTCRAYVGADGSEGFDVVPPGTTIPTNQVLPAQGIVASETSACVGCTLSQACPLFPAAPSALHTSFPSDPGAPLSPKVTVVRISATEVRFSAPAGVTVLPTGTGETGGGGSYPVQGVMTWSPSTQHGAYTSACTLPAPSASVCAASLTAFAFDFPAGGSSGPPDGESTVTPRPRHRAALRHPVDVTRAGPVRAHRRAAAPTCTGADVSGARPPGLPASSRSSGRDAVPDQGFRVVLGCRCSTMAERRDLLEAMVEGRCSRSATLRSCPMSLPANFEMT